jgi:hypothetical protein
MIRIVATLVLVGLSAQPARADDDPPALQRMRFSERGDDLVVSTNLTRIFDAAGYEHLDTGFPSTVVIRTWVFRASTGQPISFQVLQRRVVFDLWDEVYLIRLDGPGGRVERKVKFRAEALKLLTALDQVPIAKLDDLGYDEHYVYAIEAELNPVSERTLAEVRRWLSEGTGGGLDRGGSF